MRIRHHPASTDEVAVLEQLAAFTWDASARDPSNLAFLWHLPADQLARIWHDTTALHRNIEIATPVLDVPTVSEEGGDLPERAVELLGRGACFKMPRTSLWPAATAKWGCSRYLREQLRGLEDGVHVLGNTAQRKDFSYFKDIAGDECERPACCSVRMAFGDFLDHRGLDETRAVPLLEPAGVAATNVCLYAQTTLLERSDDGTMVPPAGMGAALLNDLAQLNLGLLERFRAAGKFGTWRVSQLFVGTRATAGARSTLHFDHNDNLFVQIAGVKRFRLFPPTEGGNLYAYPVFHALDRRAQVDLPRRDAAEHRKRYPRLADARGVEVVVHPGQLLFLPAYWWHEVLTEADPAAVAADALTVSVNFWFEIDGRRPIDVPLRPPIQLELARQLESLTTKWLLDGALVPAFFGALAEQWRQARRTDAAELPGACWAALHAARPPQVDAPSWQALFEYVSVKAACLLGSPRVLEFLDGLCDPARFEGVRVALEA